MTNLLIRNIRPMGGAAADLRITNGRIDAIGSNLEEDGHEIEDGRGLLALPGLVEAHTHLDKSLIGWPWYYNDVGGGNLIAMIDNERRIKRELGLDPYVQSMRHALQTVKYGTTAIRSHIDVDSEQGLLAVHGVMRTREELADVVEIDTVAFPQSGLMIRPGTAELLDEALTLGCDLVGGLDPCAVDRDPKGHLDTIFGLAEKHGKPLDIHLHELGEMGAFSMEMILDRAEALSMKGNVTISHAFCLGMPDQARVATLIERLVALDVRIMTTAPASMPTPAIQQLRAAGVKVGAGNDGIQDTWGPYGTGDMLERAKFVGLRNNFRSNEEVLMAFDVCSDGGAQAMSLEPRVLQRGAVGDVVLVQSETVAQAVGHVPQRALVVRAGRVTARDGRSLRSAP